MKQDFQSIEKIEQFLSGQLKGEDLNAFNEALLQDPALKSEVELQETIQESLSNSRKTELKARLDNITVSTIDPYRSIKIAASVIAGALLTGFLGYQVAENSTAETTQKIEVVEETVADNNTAIAEKATTNTEITASETKGNASVENNDTETKVVFNEPSTPVKAKEEETATEEKTVAVPNFGNMDDPYVPKDDSDMNFSTDDEMPEGGLSTNIDTKVAGDIVVEFESGKGDLQYKFDGPKVFLYGIDKASTKPIFYDVFMSGTKTTYMKYQGSFYSLDRSITKKTDLLEEKNASIIKELKLRYKD